MDEFPIFRNERDIEIPTLIQWLKQNDCNLGSVLDVGCAHAQYSHLVRPLVKTYDGVDLLRDEKVVKNLNRFYEGDFLFESFPFFDWIFSISTIEHIGVEYVQTPLYRQMQIEAVSKIWRLAKRGILLTFPYGEDDLFSGFYYNQNRKLLEEYRREMRGGHIHTTFVSADNPGDPDSWREIPQYLADEATNQLKGRVYTIAVMEGYK